jgi:membrane protein YqaA with SNARE-associated domain
MTFEYGYFGLFLASFLAATILPVASEIFLTTMLYLGYEPWVCVGVATMGNTMGAWLNYGIGYLGKPIWLQKLGAKQSSIDRWQDQIQRYGSWMALLCWLPIIGDVIGIALGFFRSPWLPTFLLMGVGKLLRYLMVWAGYYLW